jgi:hypothetical protein
MNQPIRGAVPAFLTPPHTLVLFTIELALRAFLEVINTILYTTKIFYFSKMK